MPCSASVLRFSERVVGRRPPGKDAPAEPGPQRRASRRRASPQRRSARRSSTSVSLDYTVALRQHTRAEEEPHGTHAARQGLGSPYGPDAAVGADAALDRPAPDPRGDDAAGLPDAEG